MATEKQAQKAKKNPHAVKSREEQSAERKRELHQIRAGMPLARAKAKGQLGSRAEIVFDESSPTGSRCRVGLKESLTLSRFQPPVSCLHLKGAGATWEQALDEARNSRSER